MGRLSAVFAAVIVVLIAITGFVFSTEDGRATAWMQWAMPVSWFAGGVVAFAVGLTVVIRMGARSRTAGGSVTAEAAENNTPAS